MAVTECTSTFPPAALLAMLRLKPLKKVFEDFPILLAGKDKIAKQFDFDKKYKIHLDKGADLEGKDSTEPRVFTDGSKTDDSTGSGILRRPKHQHWDASGDSQHCFKPSGYDMGIIRAAQILFPGRAKIVQLNLNCPAVTKIRRSDV